MVKCAADDARRPLVGILGGTFDPVHYGHLRMAEELADMLEFESVRFIPSANPPHKPLPSTRAKDRCEMIKLAIASNPRFLLDDRELKRAGASYTIDTLLSLREELGGHIALCLIMGSDAFAELDRWHRWQEILQHCHIALVERPNAPLAGSFRTELQSLLDHHMVKSAEQLSTSPAGHISVQRITALDISATAIRHHVINGRSTRYLLPDAVIAHIQQHQLYQSSTSNL
jgi:nicotinate-nucleotide adenylyltransferase